MKHAQKAFEECKNVLAHEAISHVDNIVQLMVLFFTLFLNDVFKIIKDLKNFIFRINKDKH